MRPRAACGYAVPLAQKEDCRIRRLVIDNSPPANPSRNAQTPLQFLRSYPALQHLALVSLALVSLAPADLSIDVYVGGDRREASRFGRSRTVPSRTAGSQSPATSVPAVGCEQPDGSSAVTVAALAERSTGGPQTSSSATAGASEQYPLAASFHLHRRKTSSLSGSLTTLAFGRSRSCPRSSRILS